jgi:hypothetical protein
VNQNHHESFDRLIAHLNTFADDVSYVLVSKAPIEIDFNGRLSCNVGGAIIYSNGSAALLGYSNASLLLDDGILARLQIHVKVVESAAFAKLLTELRGN